MKFKLPPEPARYYWNHEKVFSPFGRPLAHRLLAPSASWLTCFRNAWCTASRRRPHWPNGWRPEPRAKIACSPLQNVNGRMARAWEQHRRAAERDGNDAPRKLPCRAHHTIQSRCASWTWQINGKRICPWANFSFYSIFPWIPIICNFIEL